MYDYYNLNKIFILNRIIKIILLNSYVNCR